MTHLPGHRDPITLLRALTDPDPCHYDHHGRCQAHGQGSDDYCAHGAARAYLTALDGNPTPADPTPHDNPTEPHAGTWYVVRITHGTWEQHIVGRHHYRGTADLHAALRQAAAWATGRHTYDVWASHVHTTTRPAPAPLSAPMEHPMTDADVPLMLTPVRYDDHHLTQFAAYGATVDGITGYRGGNHARLMFQIVTDRAGSAMHRCTANRPPIDEDLWLAHGYIADTDGTYYHRDGDISEVTP